jgi:hypothetical protein
LYHDSEIDDEKRDGCKQDDGEAFFSLFNANSLVQAFEDLFEKTSFLICGEHTLEAKY